MSIFPAHSPGPFLNHSRGDFFQFLKPWSPVPSLDAKGNNRGQRRSSSAHPGLTVQVLQQQGDGSRPPLTQGRMDILMQDTQEAQ